MKKSLLLLMILFSVFTYGQAPKYPEKTNRFINDFANVIPDEKEEILSLICKNIEKESSTQVVVITTNDVDKEYPIEDYSIQLARNWGIGQKGVNNGLLILICPNNRKSRLEVGYGLEGILTDALTKRMQENYFKPNFRKNDFYTGIQQMLVSIKSEINPEAIQQQQAFAAQKEKESKEAWSNFWDGVFYIFIFGIIGLLLFFIIKKQVEKQKAIKKEEERKKAVLEIQRLEAERAEKMLIKKAKDLESKIIFKYTENRAILISMENFLNAKEILHALEDIFKNIRNEIEKAPYVNYESIVESGNKKIDTLCNDILSKFKIRKDVYHFVNNIFPDFKKYKSVFEKTILQTHLNYKNYDKSIWPKGFNIQDHYLERFDTICSVIENLLKDAQNNIQNLDFESASKNIKKAEDQILILKAERDSLEKINNKIETSNTYIKSGFRNDLNEILFSIDEVYSHKYIKAQTRQNWIKQRQNINLKITENYTNPLEEQKKIEEFLKTLESYKKTGLSEIEAENLRLKKIKEEEEEEERRRRRKREEEERRNSYSSYDSSSSSSFGSSSYDSDSSSGFSSGGGDFGGGGSSSDW